MGRYITGAPVFAGIVCGAYYIKYGVLLGIIAGMIVLVSSIGISRFSFLDKNKNSNASFSVIDFIGIFAGAFFWLWFVTRGYNKLPVQTLWRTPEGEFTFLSYFWTWGGSAGFMYGLIYLIGKALQNGSWSFPLPWRRDMPYSSDDRFRGTSHKEQHLWKQKERRFDFDNSGYFYDEPSNNLQIGYHAAPEKYSRVEGIRMYEISGASKNPGHTKAALALKNCCTVALGQTNSLVFLNSAARDETLPDTARQLYIHALQIAERKQ